MTVRGFRAAVARASSRRKMLPRAEPHSRADTPRQHAVSASVPRWANGKG
jgi:hypothetical protein